MLRENLEERFSHIYRKIWINKSRLNTVQVILFPLKGSNYIIKTKSNFGEITEENLYRFILSI